MSSVAERSPLSLRCAVAGGLMAGILTPPLVGWAAETHTNHIASESLAAANACIAEQAPAEGATVGQSLINCLNGGVYGAVAANIGNTTVHEGDGTPELAAARDQAAHDAQFELGNTLTWAGALGTLEVLGATVGVVYIRRRITEAPLVLPVENTVFQRIEP